MEKMLNIRELARYLGFSEITIYRKAANGELPGMKIGRSWRFPREAVDEWVREKIKAGNGRKTAT